MPTVRDALEALEADSHRHILSLSGGKDSTALAIYMQRTYPQIPFEYVFCDTGAELPETYEYLERLEVVLGVQIKRLDALDRLKIKRKPGRTAFDMWLNEVYGGYLPNPRARWCTRVLKIQPFEDYVGSDLAFSYIGIRSDENREGYTARKPPVLSAQPNILPVYPFKDDSLGLEDINDLLHDSGLGLPKYYQWRSRSGCYFCFYQQIAEWHGLRANHPALFERAKAYERNSTGNAFTWVSGRTLAELPELKNVQSSATDLESLGCVICHL